MNKNILFTILLITLLGCSKNEEENKMVTSLESYIINNATSPYDASTHIAVVGVNGILKIQNYQNGKVIHERNLYVPKSEEIDLGYGEVGIITYKPHDCLFLKKHILLQWIAYNIRYQNEDNFKTITTIYTNKLDSIGTVEATINRFSNFGEDKFIVHNSSKNKNIVYDLTGKISFEKTYNEPKYEWPTLYRNITISNTEFLDWGENGISRKCLDKGHIWSKSYKDFISNKPAQEINPPKIELIEHSLKSNILNSTFNVTYYSGEKEKVNTKIDINTGSIINN